MINDNQTNYVYLAETLSMQFASFYKRLTFAFIKNDIPFGLIPNTKDVWAVDYMPIQINKQHFVQFKYSPDYLLENNKTRKLISDVDAIMDAMKIDVSKSDIILDGGNLVKGPNKAIMTTKVFMENKTLNESALIEELMNTLQIEQLIFIPIDDGDWLGHADGMVRFIDEKTVFVNDTTNLQTEDYIDIHMALHNAGLNIVPFPYNDKNQVNLNDANGLYINFLELAYHILLPIYQLDTDKQAIQFLETNFPNKTIIPILANDIAKESGVINCCTWNILK